MKKKTYKNEENYKKRKYLFGKVKNNSKKFYFQNKLRKNESDIKNNWSIQNPKRLLF